MGENVGGGGEGEEKRWYTGDGRREGERGVSESAGGGGEEEEEEGGGQEGKREGGGGRVTKGTRGRKRITDSPVWA